MKINENSEIFYRMKGEDSGGQTYSAQGKDNKGKSIFIKGKSETSNRPSVPQSDPTQNPILKKLGLQNTNGAGRTITGRYSNGYKGEFVVIGEGKMGMFIAEDIDSPGSYVIITKSGLVLDEAKEESAKQKGKAADDMWAKYAPKSETQKQLDTKAVLKGSNIVKEEAKSQKVENTPQKSYAASQKVAEILYKDIKGIGTNKNFASHLNSIKKDNVADIVLQYNNISDKSLTNDILSEFGLSKETRLKHIDKIFNELFKKADELGIDTSQYKTKYKNMSFYVSKSNDLEFKNDIFDEALNGLAAAINGKSELTADDKTKASNLTKNETIGYLEDVLKEAKESKLDVQKMGWAGKAVDWMSQAWSYNFEKRSERIDKDIQAFEKQVDSLKKCKTEAEFKTEFKKNYGIEYDKELITAYQQRKEQLIEVEAEHFIEDQFNKKMSLLLSGKPLMPKYDVEGTEESPELVITATKEEVFERELNNLAQFYEIELAGTQDEGKGKTILENALAQYSTVEEKYSKMQEIARKISNDMHSRLIKATDGKGYKAFVKESEAMYDAAFGIKNNIAKRVEKYNIQQQTGAMILKGGTKALGAIGVAALTAATMGTGTAALAVTAGATTAISATVDISDGLTSEKGITSEELEKYLINAGIDGLTALAGGGIAKALSNAKTFVKVGGQMIGDVAVGAAAEKMQTGEITLSGVVFQCVFSTAGSLVSIKPKGGSKGANVDTNPKMTKGSGNTSKPAGETEVRTINGQKYEFDVTRDGAVDMTHARTKKVGGQEPEVVEISLEQEVMCGSGSEPVAPAESSFFKRLFHKEQRPGFDRKGRLIEDPSNPNYNGDVYREEMTKRYLQQHPAQSGNASSGSGDGGIKVKSVKKQTTSSQQSVGSDKGVQTTNKTDTAVPKTETGTVTKTTELQPLKRAVVVGHNTDGTPIGASVTNSNVILRGVDGKQVIKPIPPVGKSVTIDNLGGGTSIVIKNDGGKVTVTTVEKQIPAAAPQPAPATPKPAHKSVQTDNPVNKTPTRQQPSQVRTETNGTQPRSTETSSVKGQGTTNEAVLGEAELNNTVLGGNEHPVASKPKPETSVPKTEASTAYKQGPDTDVLDEAILNENAVLGGEEPHAMPKQEQEVLTRSETTTVKKDEPSVTTEPHERPVESMTKEEKFDERSGILERRRQIRQEVNQRRQPEIDRLQEQRADVELKYDKKLADKKAELDNLDSEIDKIGSEKNELRQGISMFEDKVSYKTRKRDQVQQVLYDMESTKSWETMPESYQHAEEIPLKREELLGGVDKRDMSRLPDGTRYEDDKIADLIHEFNRYPDRRDNIRKEISEILNNQNKELDDFNTLIKQYNDDIERLTARNVELRKQRSELEQEIAAVPNERKQAIEEVDQQIADVQTSITDEINTPEYIALGKREKILWESIFGGLNN